MNPDSGYRRVLLSKAPVGTKLAALQAMTAPSERLLLRLIRDRATHPKLILLASDLLKKRQHKKTLNIKSDLLGLRIKI